VFSIFSVTKAFTNVLALAAIEQGRLALTTPIAQIIPEFSGGLRDKITIFHLMTHTSGLPMVFSPKPDMYIDRLDEIIAAICQNVQPAEPAGEHVAYSPICNHALLGEALRRIDPRGRSYRAIVAEDLTGPLSMSDTSIGLRADLRERHVVPDFRGNFPINHPGHSNLGPNGAFEEEHAEMPWVGAASTVPDMLRFAEMLRQGGRLGEARILSPATLELATRNFTGERPNELYKLLAHRRGWEPAPAYIGLGFSLRGTAICRHLFGTLSSPGTFGNYGAGSALFWVDPARDLTFVCLSAGVMESNDNIERFQRLSDMVVSAAL
jgi:CubicO group peptidase (beta-lactamase class C family)